MLIRHAEEPDAARGVAGVDEHGHPDADALSVRGWQRAGALVRLFAPLDGRARPHLARPMAIYAAGDAGQSRRPLCTVQPLAAALGLTIDTGLGSQDDAARVVERVTRDAGPVLLSWRHDALPALAAALVPAAAAAHWDEARYDLVWTFERHAGRWHFYEEPQRLLAGDRDAPAAGRRA
jgi:hypothetical protein